MKALLFALVAPTFIVRGDRVTCRPGYAPSKVRLSFLVVIIKMLPFFVKVFVSNVDA